jgi:NADH:ubiquinone oxidoreductase subunit 4 (subunit M)
VEAPTIGSILLAGILLKLSFYAFLRLIFFFIDG